MAGWEERVRELYRLDPDDFVAARNELAKEVRAEDRKAASVIRNLAKPTVVAWALNQVAATDGALVEALLSSTTELRAAQQRALAGDRAALKKTSEKRRVAVAALVDAAVSGLAARGRPGEAHRDTLRNTVEAASFDAESADALREGRLERELDAPAMFGGLPDAGEVEPSSPTGRQARATDGEEREREARRLRAEAEDLAELAATARERAQEAAGGLRDAREAVTEAERALDAARRQLDRAMDVAKTTSLRAAEVERRAEEAALRARELE